MDFTNMNFGELLFALKINKSIVHSKNGIYFNEICLKEGLHPKFPNIYIYRDVQLYGHFTRLQPLYGQNT